VELKTEIKGRLLEDGSIERLETPFENISETKRGRSTGRNSDDRSHLYTRKKITFMKIQVMGCSAQFKSMLTVQFDWGGDGDLIKKGIKNLKRKLKSLMTQYGGSVYYGVFEGRMFKGNNRSLEIIPPHYHIIFDWVLSQDDKIRLERLIQKWGFSSSNIEEDLSDEANLKFRKYICKDDKSTGHWSDIKPTMCPSHWMRFNIPATFKSSSFLEYQTNDIVTLNTEELLKISSRQPFYKLQYLKSEQTEDDTNINPDKSTPINCYDLKHLKLKIMLILIAIFCLFPDRFFGLPQSYEYEIDNSPSISPQEIHKPPAKSKSSDLDA